MSTVLSTDLFVPAAIAFITGFALYKKTDVFASFTKGAKEGLASAVSILPALCFLMTAVGMLRQSGFVEMLTGFVSPLAEKIGFCRRNIKRFCGQSVSVTVISLSQVSGISARECS